MKRIYLFCLALMMTVATTYAATYYGFKVGGVSVNSDNYSNVTGNNIKANDTSKPFSVVYNIGKKRLISFCVDTGFMCFGLVDQDYELPEDVLNSIGIDTIEIPRKNIDYKAIETTKIHRSIEVKEYETIDITVLRRGVIGVNKVGYEII